MIERAGLGIENRIDFSPLLLHIALNAGQFGLVLSNALTLMGMFQWSIRQSIEVENMVTLSYSS